LAKDKTFESYNLFTKIGGVNSEKSILGISFEDIFNFILAKIPRRCVALIDRFTPEDITHLISFHSSKKDGFLSFMDFS